MPTKRTAYAVAQVILVVITAMLANCATPTDEWFAQRAALTGATEIIDTAHIAGLIEDDEFLDVYNPAIQTGRQYLDQAFKHLPDGGPAFEKLMDLLDAVLVTLNQYNGPPLPLGHDVAPSRD